MMRRADVAIHGFTINERGIVTAPGKFEGEPWYAVSLWDMVLNGLSDDTTTDDNDSPTDWFTIDVQDTNNVVCDLPADLVGKRIGIYEDESGFVRLLMPEGS